MRGAFDDERETRQQKPSNDTEFTLGAGTLLLLFGGLVVVCTICFGLGYIYGSRRASTQAAGPQASAITGLQANGSQQKPSATAQVPAPVQPAPQTDDSSQPVAGNPPQTTTAVAVPVSAVQTPAQPVAQPQVRPALAVTAPVPQSAPSSLPRLPANTPQPQAGPAVAQPTQPQPTLWVQIAAVSHDEDAAVLTEALKKRGYSVTNRRQSDNLIHVRIGPFNSRDEANQWRTKLLDDGYNAEVQQ
jgi:Uncharacterized protein conserved in bacteria